MQPTLRCLASTRAQLKLAKIPAPAESIRPRGRRRRLAVALLPPHPWGSTSTRTGRTRSATGILLLGVRVKRVTNVVVVI